MKTSLIGVDGKKGKEITLPVAFSAPVREDVIAKVLETFKVKQPYAPNPVAGMQYSASGKLRHRRHVWKAQYGRGISRIPRKVMTRRGSQFNWIGATVPSTRGGRRAHAPKVLSMINTKKINKKEARLAFISALAATANPKEVSKKYAKLKGQKIEVPFIVEDKIARLKAKELSIALKKILGDAYETARQTRSVRAGKGKMRGRKYKKSAGLLIVVGKEDKLKSSIFDVVKANSVGVLDLAKGGQGRLVVYTENAIKEIEARLKAKEKSE